MKLFLLIFALTCHQLVSAQAPGGYTLVDPDEVSSDQSIQDALNFGAHYVLDEGTEKNLPDESYEIRKINSVHKQVVNGVNYQFDVQLTGDQGTVVNAIYVVYIQAGATAQEVTSYEYNVEGSDITGSSEDSEEEHDVSEEEDGEEHITGGYTQLDLSDVENDSEISELVNFGVQHITQQEVLAQKLPDAQYGVDKIHSAYSQVVSGMNYRFDVDITNDQGWVLRATFVVYDQPWTGTREVSSYVYAVTTNPNPSEEEEFVLPNEEDLDGGYSEVDPSELDTDQELRDALDYGVEIITEQATLDHNLPESNYEVIEVHSIYSQVVAGMNYRFDVSLKNCAGLVVRAVFTVFSQDWTQTLDATPGSLEITSIPEEGLIGGDCSPEEPDNNEEESLPEEEQWLGDEEGDIAGGWTSIDLDDANSDPLVQELLNFGAQYVANQGIEAHRLPAYRYDVSNVFGVENQVVSGFNYRFDVELKNCQGLTVRANYIVYYQAWTDTKKVSDYSFDITAAPNGPIVEGCSLEVDEEEDSVVVAEESIIVAPDEDSTESESIAGGWTEVSLDEAKSDTNLQNALAVGVNQATQQAAEIGTIPDDEYRRSELLSAEKQVVNGINYRFSVRLEFEDGTVARIDLEVYSPPSGNQELTSYEVVPLNR